MKPPEDQEPSVQGLRKGRRYQTISPGLLARVMGFTDQTMRRYIHKGFLPSVQCAGQTWAVQPRQNWNFLQISKLITDQIAGRRNSSPHVWTVPYLTTRSAGELLGVSQRRIQKMIAEGILSAVRINPHCPYRCAPADVARAVRRRLDGMTSTKRGQARAQLQVLRKLARGRLR